MRQEMAPLQAEAWSVAQAVERRSARNVRSSQDRALVFLASACYDGSAMDNKRSAAEGGYFEAVAGAWAKLVVTSIVQVIIAIVWPLISFSLMSGRMTLTWPFAVIDSITIICPMVVLLWTWISYWQYVRSLARHTETAGEAAGGHSEEAKQGSVLQRLELELEILRLRVLRGICLTWSFSVVLLALSVLLRFVFALIAE